MSSKEWLDLFVAKVNVLMEMKKLTVSDLAAKIGAPDVTVERWVTGQRMPSSIAIVRLAKALDVEIKTLIDFED